MDEFGKPNRPPLAVEHQQRISRVGWYPSPKPLFWRHMQPLQSASSRLNSALTPYRPTLGHPRPHPVPPNRRISLMLPLRYGFRANASEASFAFDKPSIEYRVNKQHRGPFVGQICGELTEPTQTKVRWCSINRPYRANKRTTEPHSLVLVGPVCTQLLSNVHYH